MTDPDFSETVQALVPPRPVTLTAAEITGLIGLFQTMLDKTEGRILDAMADNSERATERWAKHDRELEANTRRVAERFAAVDARLQATVGTLQELLDREHDDDVRMDARIRPIRGSLAWLWGHWRDIVLLIIGLIAMGTFLVESFGRVLGPHPL
jgi:hypothetical protein